MRRTYGYDSYRGRFGWRNVLTILIVFLLVVLAAAVAAFFLLQKYVVYTDDGQARLELPFLQQKESLPPASAGVGEPPVVVVTAQPSPAPEEEFLRAAVLPRSALYDGTAEEQVAAAGGNAAWFDMKADDGTLGYVSTCPPPSASALPLPTPPSTRPSKPSTTGGSTR